MLDMFVLMDSDCVGRKKYGEIWFYKVNESLEDEDPILYLENEKSFFSPLF